MLGGASYNTRKKVIGSGECDALVIKRANLQCVLDGVASANCVHGELEFLFVCCRTQKILKVGKRCVY